MKIALCTTTINEPNALRAIVRKADMVAFRGVEIQAFIAGDAKSPHHKIIGLLDDIGQPLENYSSPEDQAKVYPRLAELVPLGCIQRRNFATLDALRWGADFIVMWDDDNLVVDNHYLIGFEGRITKPHTGLIASPEVDWFDVGAFLDPPSSHRGFPYELAHRKPRLSHIVDAKIGACAGIVLGDPDISAATRISKSPHVLNVSPLLNAGIAVNPRHTRTVFNTQNSAVIRELAPAMLLCPQFKRFDDIIASLVCQRIMADTGHHVMFGLPFVYQERNAHDLTRDLADEQWGQTNILSVQRALWQPAHHVASDSISDKVRGCYGVLDTFMPGVAALCDAWLEDCERAMA